MMKRIIEVQRAFALRQDGAGMPVSEIARKMCIIDLAFYRWKRLFEGLEVNEICRLKRPEDPRLDVS